jgi:type I restriction enzyme, S subunit
MNKNNNLVPKLRFPEFVNEEEWDNCQLQNIVVEFIVPMRDKPKDLTGEIPWCRIEDFNGMYLSGSKTKQGVSRSTIKEMNLKVYPVNTLLVSCSADLGRCAITIKELITNQTFIGLVPNIDKTKVEFLYYLMINNKDRLNALSSGTTISYLSRQQFENLKVKIPNVVEQQKIASCLSSLDELIAAHTDKLEALKDHKKGLMQQLFPAEGETVPKLRFKEFENDGEWVEKTIGDFIKSHKGGAPLTPSDFVTMSESEVIPKKAIGEGMWLKIEAPVYCSEKFYKNNEQSIVDNTYLITTLRDLVPSGPNIGYIVKYNNSKKYILAQGVYGLKIKNNLFPDFLIHFSNTKKYRKMVNKIMVGSTQVHIRNGEFFKVKLNIPVNLIEQQKIANFLSSIDDEIAAQAQKIDRLKEHKKGLMQGLFPVINE